MTFLSSDFEKYRTYYQKELDHEARGAEMGRLEVDRDWRLRHKFPSVRQLLLLFKKCFSR